MLRLRFLLLGLALLTCAPTPAVAQEAASPVVNGFATMGVALGAPEGMAVFQFGGEGERMGAHFRYASQGGGWLSVESHQSYALLVHRVYQAGRRAHARVGVGPSLTVRKAEEGSNWGPSPDETANARGVGLALGAAAGVQVLRTFALEAQVLGDVNAVRTFFGVGVGVGFRW